MPPALATAMVTTYAGAKSGSARVQARHQHLRVDSPAQLGGPNQTPTPVELLLAALGTSAIFVCQACARERCIPLDTIRITVLGDFDPRGIQGEPVAPYLQGLRLRASLTGPNRNQAEVMMDAVRTRCPIYTTLAQAGMVELEVLITDSGAGHNDLGGQDKSLSAS
jgi:uncharacterized OsmC-like protein